MAHADNSAEVDRGLAWLTAQVGNDGAVQGSAASIATLSQIQAEVLQTLAQLGTVPAPLAQRVASNTETTTEALAQSAISLVRGGQSAATFVAVLRARQNSDGGFGDQADTLSNTLDTSWALLAFRASGFTDYKVLKAALDYLISTAHSDGGYAAPGSDNAVYTTSYALQALAAYRDAYALSPYISKSIGWLRTERGNNAGYGESLYDALATIALASATTDSTQYGSLLTALKAAQSADGSWASDPYLTSLALRALAGQAQPPATVSKGRVVGQVSDAATRAPLAAATISVAGHNLSTTASGQFDIGDITPGNYSLGVGKVGYASVQRQLNIAAGAVVDVGTVSLLVLEDAAAVHGAVFDGSSGQPLAGATVAVTVGVDSFSVLAGNNGAFELTGIPAGSGTIVVSKAGYRSAAQALSFEPGSSYGFSPSLYPDAEPAPTQASIVGRVLAADSGAAISGARVSVGDKFALSASNGSFQIDGLEAGAIDIQVEATGYEASGFDAVISAGINRINDLRIAAAADSLTLFGRVTNADDNTPVAAASVRVQGTNVQVVTNSQGNYRIEGLPETHASLLAEAVGHYARTYAVNTPGFGSYRVDLKLDKAQDKGIKLRAAAVLPDYGPYGDVEVEAVATNEDSRARTVAFSATVYDAQRQVVEFIPMRLLQIGQPLIEGPYSLSAGASLDMLTRWNNKSIAPGDYTVVILAAEPDGEILAETSVGITINPGAALGGYLHVNPPITQAGTDEAVSISAQVGNRGNQGYPGGSATLAIILDAQDPNPGMQPGTLDDVLIGAPLNQPVGAVTDVAGNLYTVNGDRQILRVAPTGQITSVVTLDSGQNAADLTMMSDGGLRVLTTAGQIVPITAAGVKQEAQSTPLNSGASITGDPDGNLYVMGMRLGADALYRINPAGGSEQLLGSGLSNPKGIMKDASGRFYISNTGNNTIARIESDGRMAPFITSGLSSPGGMLLEPSGSFLLADGNSNRVLRIGMDKSISVFATGIFSPQGLAYDAAGNVIVSSVSATPLYRVSPAGQVSPFVQSLGAGTSALTYDTAGRLYAAGGDGSLRRVGSSGAIEPLLGSGKLGAVKEIAFGADAALYSVAGSTTVLRHELGTSVATTYATGFTNAAGLAVDANGALLVADQSTSNIVRVLAGGSKEVLAQPLMQSAVAVAATPDGSRYILNNSNLTRIPASGRAGILVASLGGTGRDIAPNPEGGVYVLIDGTKLNAVSDAGAMSVRTTVPASKRMAVATDGTVYLADSVASKIYRLRPDNSLETFSTTPFTVNDLEVDATGVIAGLADGFLYRFADNGTYVKGANTGALSALSTASDGSTYALRTSGAFIRVDGAGQITTLVSGNATQFVRLVDGRYDLLESGGSLLRQYDAANQLLRTVAGFLNPRDVEWADGEIVFSDFTRIYRMSPDDGVPRLLSSTAVVQLRFSAGDLYATVNFSGQVVRISPAGSVSNVVNDPSLLALSSLAMYNGDIAVLNTESQRVLVYGPDRVVKASYSGVPNAAGIAVDASGRVHAAASSNFAKGVVRFSTDGMQSELLPLPSTPASLAFAPDGALWATSGAQLMRYNGSQFVAMLASPGPSLAGLMISDGQVYVTDSTKLYRLDGNALSVVATGIVNARTVRRGADGALYIAGASGTVSRYADGAIKVIAGGMPSLSTLAVSSETGVAYAAMQTLEGDSYVYRVDIGTGAIVEQKLGRLLYREIPKGIAFNPQGLPLIVTSAAEAGDTRRNAIYRLHPSVPVPLVAPGTEVYRTTTALGAIAVNGEQSLSLGQWLPPYAGDFRLRLLPQGGSESEIQTSLHVGPHAEGQIIADRAVVTPEDAVVQLTVSVSGADFLTASRPDAASMRNVTSLPTMVYMGADPSGNIFFGNATKIVRVTPTGTRADFYIPAGSTIDINGTLPIDAQANLYVANSLKQILRIAPNAGSQIVATMPVAIKGMVLDSHGDLIAVATNSDLYRVKPDGSYSRMKPAGNNTYYALTIDGKDNLYVLQAISRTVVKITPDGVSSVVATGDASFEYEGNGATIAGDCADNLFLLPRGWPSMGQPNDPEEYSLYQVTAGGLASKIYDGVTGGGALTDMDFMVYDRYSKGLLLWTDSGENKVSRMPITCGAISTDLHVVTKAGQVLSGFNTAPAAVNGTADGGTEYVWNFADLDNSGRSAQFGTTLPGMTLAEELPVLAEAFLLFRNTFTGNDIKLPLEIPSVRATGALSMSLSTGAASYPANSPVQVNLQLINGGGSRMTGQLRLELYDAGGVLVQTVMDEVQSVEPGLPLTLSPQLDTGTYMAGSYQLKASFTDGTGRLQAHAEAGFDISASGSDPAGEGAIKVVPTTDKQAYGEYDLVQMLGRARSLATNFAYEDITLRLSVADALGAVVYSQNRAIAQLRPGAMVDFADRYALPGASIGTYSLKAEALAKNGTVLTSATTAFEVRRDNATKLTGAVVATPKDPYLGDLQACSDTIRNGGSEALSALPIRRRIVELDADRLVSEEVTEQSLAAGTERTLNRSFSTQGYNLGAHACVLEAQVDGQWKTLGYARFTVAKVPVLVSGTVAAALKPVFQGDPQTCSGAVRNNGPRALQGLPVRQTVTQLSPERRILETAGVISVPAGGLQALPQVFDTDDYELGNYSCALEAQVDGQWKTLASDSFTVAKVPVLVSGSVVASLKPVPQGETQTCKDSIHNDGSHALQDLPIRQRIMQLSPERIITEATATQSLPPGGQQTLTRVFSIDSHYELGPHACVLEAQVDGQWKTLGYDNFTIDPPPIKLSGEIKAGDKGRLLVLMDGPTNGSQGGPLCHNGLFDVLLEADFSPALSPDAVVEVKLLDRYGLLIDVESTSLLSFNGEVNGRAGSRGIDLLIPSFSAGELVIGLTGAAGQQVIDGTYQVVAKVGAATRVLNLQTGLISLGCNTVHAVGDTLGQVFRILGINNGVHAGEGIGDGADKVAAATQRQFLESLLRGEGWSYKIVTSKADFARELRSGAYQNYALLSEYVVLDEQVQKELREAVHRGEGLLAAGRHDVRRRILDQPLGVQYSGTQLAPVGIEMQPGSPLGSGQAVFGSGNDVQRIKLTGASKHGKLISTVPSAQDSTVTVGPYGKGKSALGSFDVLGEASLAGSGSLFRQLIGQSLIHVNPPQASPQPGRTVPLKLHLSNEGNAVSVVAKVSLSAGGYVVDAKQGTVAAGKLEWSFELAAGASIDNQLWVRLPPGGLPVMVSAQLTATSGTQTVDAGTITAELSPPLQPSLDDALAALTAYAATKPNPGLLGNLLGLIFDTRHPSKKALDHLKAANRALDQGDTAKALAELVLATDELIHDGSTQAAPIRHQVDEAIFETGQLQ
ncbi:carboxypeptidase regulatory-like domain-containing protein [Solimonas sp. K1W22B-7]|uniref:carboxypeptidase regulatory-like domain-containing protein n=1 Tax=Solimonas sp. K1W22B-7 TaxID=2303331 RepID=UPI0013C49F0D|nr:carboxypeptidase regulatory-like domain-containing protein [Solimonas sp. K1W22B-7]